MQLSQNNVLWSTYNAVELARAVREKKDSETRLRDNTSMKFQSTTSPSEWSLDSLQTPLSYKIRAADFIQKLCSCPLCHHNEGFQISGDLLELLTRAEEKCGLKGCELVLHSSSSVSTRSECDMVEGYKWKMLLHDIFENLAEESDYDRNSNSGFVGSLKRHMLLRNGSASGSRSYRKLVGRRPTNIDLNAFMKVFPHLPGVVGERLFAAFDKDKNGRIDFQEFLSGLAVLNRAKLEEKIEFVFNMYDLNGDGEISQDEMAMMLFHVPICFSLFSSTKQSFAGSRRDSEEAGSLGDVLVKYLHSQHATAESVLNFEFVIDELVARAFEILPETKNSMNFVTFCKAVNTFPELRYALGVFCKETIRPQDFMPAAPFNILTIRETKRSCKSITSHEHDRRKSGCTGFDATCRFCGNSFAALLRASAFLEDFDLESAPALSGKRLFSEALPCFSTYGKVVDYAGWLEKDGRKFGQPVRRFYVLRNRFLYYYASPVETIPLKAFLVTGWYIYSTGNKNSNYSISRSLAHVSLPENISPKVPPRFVNRFGFELIPSCRKKRRKRLYAQSEEECTEWVKWLSKAAGVDEEFHYKYIIEQSLGRGKFATVYRATNRRTRKYITENRIVSVEKVAVKILTKPRHRFSSSSGSCTSKKRVFCGRILKRRSSSMGSTVPISDLQRTEVAILKLLYHPNLVRLIDIFTSPSHIYIVMEGGPSKTLGMFIEMLQFVNKNLDRNTLLWMPEFLAREITLGMLQGLVYLHSPKRSVIHRDLKPDNVLIQICIRRLCSVLYEAAICLPPLLPEAKHDEAGPVRETSSASSLDTVDFYPSVSPEEGPICHKFAEMHCVANMDELTQVATQSSTPEVLNLWILLHCWEWICSSGTSDNVPPFLKRIPDLRTACPDQSHVKTEALFEPKLLEETIITKITDFGLSKILGPSSDLSIGFDSTTYCNPAAHIGTMKAYASEPLGTAAYAAPEILCGINYTTSVDMWSLGVIVYQLLSGGSFPVFQCGEATVQKQWQPELNFEVDLEYVPRQTWMNHSRDAKDFVLKLLDTNPRTRLSATQALEHPWIIARGST